MWQKYRATVLQTVATKMFFLIVLGRNKTERRVISGFGREVGGNCVLGNYATSSGNLSTRCIITQKNEVLKEE